jgi:basic membrane protein A and related proteins
VKTARLSPPRSSFPRALLAAVLGLGAAGCAGGTAAVDSNSGSGSGDLTAGFIYVGPKDDYGYNQAHALGAAAVKRLPGVTVLEEERVAETVDVQKSMKSMIEDDGAKVLFPTSFGYFDPHILKMAKEYPDVAFLHCGGLYDASKHPKNVGSYFGYIWECQYLSGIVAGHASKAKKIGFVAAKPIPQVLLNVNAFTLGARSVDPKITCTVVFTGDWSMPVKEAEATNGLIDQGIDVVTCHVDSPKVVVETAERRGVLTCGYHCSQAVLAPKGYLTGAEWNWEKVYTDYLTLLRSGKPLPNLLRGGLKEGIVKTSPYGPSVSAEARSAAEAVKEQFLAGTFAIFTGPLKDNKGNEILPEGKSFGRSDTKLEEMDYLVEGVIGQ